MGPGDKPQDDIREGGGAIGSLRRRGESIGVSPHPPKLIPAPSASRMLPAILSARVVFARRAEGEGRRRYLTSGAVSATTQVRHGSEMIRGSPQGALLRCENIVEGRREVASKNQKRWPDGALPPC